MFLDCIYIYITLISGDDPICIYFSFKTEDTPICIYAPFSSEILLVISNLVQHTSVLH